MISFRQYLEEKLIIVNKNKRNGQVILLSGGGGSGKSFAMKRFIDANNYKVLNVDDLKDQFIQLGKKDNPLFTDYKNLDTRNPNDVFTLHKKIANKGIVDKKLDNILNNANPDRLNNLLFDCTLKDMNYLKNIANKLIKTGYKAEDIHIIWILSNYKIAVMQNKNRKRVVPDDVLLKTHEGAATSMDQIIKGKYDRKFFNGELYVLLNDVETQVKTGTVYKDFAYLKIKDVGKDIKNDATIQMQLYVWIKQNIPMTKETKDLFD